MSTAHHSSSSVRPLSRLFTRPALVDLAKRGDSKAIVAYLRAHSLGAPATERPLASLFDSAFGLLRQHLRTEYVYKAELANRIVFGRHSPRTAALQLELPVGRSIVDVAVVNGTSTAYEIKTELDSPRRLTLQSCDYLRVFDRVYVVTHPNLAHQYRRLADGRVGILVLKNNGSLTTVREAKSNLAHVEPSALFRCLRRAEYLELLQQRFGSIEEPNGLIAERCEALFSSLSPKDAHAAFVTAHYARTTDALTVDFLLSLPPSLRALAAAVPLSQRARATLVGTLNGQVQYALH